MKISHFTLFLFFFLQIKCSNQEINETIFNYINTGKYKEMEEYLDSLKSKNISFKKELVGNIENKVKELNNLFDKLSKLDSSNKKLIAPAFYWFEDYFSITLMIFYSYRHNTPGCGEIDDYLAVLYNNERSFHFNANCTMGDEEKYFSLDLNIYKKLKKITGVVLERGKAIVKIDKKDIGFWDRLLLPGEEIPKNMLRGVS